MVPILVIPLATIALTLNAYLRLVLTDVAIEGARTSALADQSLADGADRAKVLLKAALGRDLSPKVSAQQFQNPDGVWLVRFTIQIDKPIFLAVTSHAVDELQE